MDHLRSLGDALLDFAGAHPRVFGGTLTACVIALGLVYASPSLAEGVKWSASCVIVFGLADMWRRSTFAPPVLGPQRAARTEIFRSNGRPAALSRRASASRASTPTPMSIALDERLPDLEHFGPRIMTLAPEGVEIRPRTARTGVGCPQWADAALRPAPGGALVLSAPENPGSPAAWYDWGDTTPLSYSTVLPLRTDCGRSVFFGFDLDRDLARDLAGGLAITAAAAVDAGRHERRYAHIDFTRPLTAAVNAARALAFEAPVLASAAARPLGAILVSPMGESLDDARRAELAGRVTHIIPEDTESWLRLGACCFAAGDEAGAISAFRVAQRRVLADPRRAQCPHPTPYLQSELATGVPTPLTAGRLAAGFTFVIAMTPDDMLSFVSEDLTDDLTSHHLHGGLGIDAGRLDALVRALRADRVTPESAPSSTPVLGVAA